ncbi:hypothetical protein CICLE_v10029908mg, partial [Citrus x clementina]
MNAACPIVTGSIISTSGGLFQARSHDSDCRRKYFEKERIKIILNVIKSCTPILNSSRSSFLNSPNPNNNNSIRAFTLLSYKTPKIPTSFSLAFSIEIKNGVEFIKNDDGLADVINRLNLLRGKGMASMYSWSSKRSYKNGFVWHDLSEDDLIYPAHGQEYVLKGSEIVDPSPLSGAKAHEMAASSSFRVLKSGDESADFPVITRRRNQSWSSIDLNEYKVYKAEPNSESFRRLAADASTQTDDKRRRRRPVKVDEEGEQEQKSQSQSQSQEMYANQTTELSREEISPPPSDSSPETLESLMKADGRLILCDTSSNNKNNNDDSLSNRTADNNPSGRMKASTVLMQLISCGSISFKDCGAGNVKDQGFSLIGHYKARLPRGQGDKKEAVADGEIRNFPRVRLEDKEYFSGSLIETNRKEEVPSTLKRSNSYNAERFQNYSDSVFVVET